MEQKSYYLLYRMIGYLGLALFPLVVWKCGFDIPPSYSQSYYLGAIVPFVFVMGAMGIVFFCNKGFDLRDEVCNKISGLASIGVVSFTCESIFSTLHYISAIILFSTFAFMCFFVFTQLRSSYDTPLKRLRNKVYRICGTGILLGIIFFLSLKGKNHIFWSEELMIISFVTAYLIQGGVALKHKNDERPTY